MKWRAVKYPDAKLWTVVDETGKAVACKIKTEEEARILAAAPGMADLLGEIREWLIDALGEDGEGYVAEINEILATAKGKSK